VDWPCLSPQEIRTAYNINPLLNAGYTGKGQTIVIIDSFGSPTIEQDLKKFDAGYGLPDPPSFQIISPLGTVPYDPTNDDQVSWAFETSLDVQWAHAIAPEANIVLLTSPVSETQGIAGLPEFAQLIKYALDHRLGNIISQSWGTAENTLFNDADRHIFNEFNALYARAAAQGVTVLGVTGDFGASNPDTNGGFFPFPTVQFPGSSPFVTAVGGTSLRTDTRGNYQSETVWNNIPLGSSFATGGGISQQFSMPAYQAATLPGSMKEQLKGHRGVPDMAYSANARTASVLAYCSFLGAGTEGFYLFGGTSEGAPQWAGIVAIANQYAHHPLGFLNPKLYALGKLHASSFYHDVTSGNNSGRGVTGYEAAPGWDLTTGWGTPNADALVRALARL
jgi:subtilase family serine protease